MCEAEYDRLEGCSLTCTCGMTGEEADGPVLAADAQEEC